MQALASDPEDDEEEEEEAKEHPQRKVDEAAAVLYEPWP